MTIAPITPTARREAFDGPEWTYVVAFALDTPVTAVLRSRVVGTRRKRRMGMSLLLQISGVSHPQYDIAGEYDENAQMWTTHADLSSARELPAAILSPSATSDGGRDGEDG